MPDNVIREEVTHEVFAKRMLFVFLMGAMVMSLSLYGCNRGKSEGSSSYMKVCERMELEVENAEMGEEHGEAMVNICKNAAEQFGSDEKVEAAYKEILEVCDQESGQDWMDCYFEEGSDILKEHGQKAKQE